MEGEPAATVTAFLDGVIAAPPPPAVRDAWTVLPGGVRVTYRVTPEAVIVQNITPPA